MTMLSGLSRHYYWRQETRTIEFVFNCNVIGCSSEGRRIFGTIRSRVSYFFLIDKSPITELHRSVSRERELPTPFS